MMGIESVIGPDGLMPKVVSVASGGAIPPWGYVSPDAIEQPRFRDLLNLWGVRYLLIRSGSASPLLARYYTYVTTIDGVEIFETPMHIRGCFLRGPRRGSWGLPRVSGER